MPIYFGSEQRSINEYYGKHDIQSLFITEIIREINFLENKIFRLKKVYFHLLFVKNFSKLNIFC